MHIGGTEIVVVLVLFFLLFGAKKLPEAAKSLGKALRAFKKEMRNVTDESIIDEEDVSEDKNREGHGQEK